MEEIKNDYIHNRYTFVRGSLMEKTLKYFEAKDKDLRKLQFSGKTLYNDPTLPFRKSRNGKFLINYNDCKIYRLEYQSFILHKEEYFIRDDSEMLRSFKGIQYDIQFNTAFIGLLRF